MKFLGDLAQRWYGLAARAKREPVGAALFSLAGDSAVYLAGGIVIGLGNVVLVPVYTRYLAPREFGIYALVDIVILLVVTLTALKLDVSYLKWFAEIDTSRHGELLGSVLMTGFAASALGGSALTFLLVSRMGEHWLRASVRSFAWMILPLVVLENLQALLLTDLLARRRAIAYSSSAICRVAVLVIASFYLLGVQHLAIEAIFLGRLIGDAAGVAVLAGFCLGQVRWKFSVPLIKPMLWFGLPLVWSVLTVALQDTSGRYFLNRYSSLEQVGLLGSAIKIGAVFQLLISSPFGVAWSGMLFQIVKERDAQVIYSKIFGYVYVLALGLALVLTIFAPTLFHIFTAPAYYPAIALLPLVLLVRAMSVIEQPASTGIYLSGRTDLLALSYTVALSLNLLLLWMLVPRYGIMGVGWAWLLGSAAVPLLFLIFGQKHYRLSFHARLQVVPILPWLAVLLLLPRGFSLWLGHSLFLQCVLTLVVLLAMGVLLFYDFRGLRRQLQTRGACAPALEAPSQ